MIKYTTDEPLPGIIEDFARNTPLTAALTIQPTLFRNEVEIQYLVREKGAVKLLIYDASGRMVYNLVDNNSKAGNHSIRWNGKDNLGRKLASGVYFFELKTPSEQYLKKVVRLK